MENNIGNIIFTPSVNNKKYLHFQCNNNNNNNMTLGQITHDINEYVLEHREELYLDKTEFPIYFKRWVLVGDNTLWNK